MRSERFSKSGNRLRGGDPWYVLHLHSRGVFSTLLPGLRDKLLAAARGADREQGWGLLSEGDDEAGNLHVRVAEYHRMVGTMFRLFWFL